MHDAIPYRPFTMSDQATVAAQPFPPGMSRLERLPDELKLRVGYFLTPPPAAKPTRKRYGRLDLDDFRDVYPDLPQWQAGNILVYRDTINPFDEHENLEFFGNGHRYNDSVLALASTSNRLCDIFLVEHSKKYGLQHTLFRSIELGNLSLVQRVVEYGADINKTGTEAPWKITALRLAVQLEQLPVIVYLLRRGVDKVGELFMDILRDRDYYRRSEEDIDYMLWGFANLKNQCRCKLLRALMDATLGSSQTATSQSKPRLPSHLQQALIPTGRHLWFILRTCMIGDWGCSCGDNGDGDCPQRLISLLRRYGAKWMPCGACENVSQASHYLTFRDDDRVDSYDIGGRHAQRRGGGRGLADLRRFDNPVPNSGLHPDRDDPIVVKPSVAGAMNGTLLKNTTYKRDHCIPFLVSMLQHGVAAEQGDLSYAMDLASTPDTKQLSIAIVVALLRAGTNPNEPGAMKTAMRLACMDDTKDAAVAFVTLLLEHGADPSAEELRDEIQGAAEKWWIQSAWQSSGVFRRILRLLVDGGLDECVAWEILAVLGLDHDLPAEGGGGSTKV